MPDVTADADVNGNGNKINVENAGCVCFLRFLGVRSKPRRMNRNSSQLFGKDRKRK